MNYQELKEKIREIYGKKFNDSLCTIDTGILSSNTIFIKLFLAKDTTELANGYFDNDMFHIMFEIRVNSNLKTDEIDFSNVEMILENCSNWYAIVPPNDYLCYGSNKVNFRKTTGNVEKILKSFENYVNKLYDSVKADFETNGNIHKNFIELVAKKI